MTLTLGIGSTVTVFSVMQSVLWKPLPYPDPVVGEGAALAALGGVIGLAGALAATDLLRGLLYDVTPFDAPTLVVVCVVVGAAAVLAAAAPAWRAAHIDPNLSLRAE